jgi:hypothetical protein
MGEAFDRACHSLHDNGQPDLVRQIISQADHRSGSQGRAQSR